MTSQCQDHAAESARAEYMKEAERLLSEYGDAVSDAVVFAQDPAGYSMRMEEATRAAMLAHIQSGAVPDGWQLVPKEPTPEMLAGGWGYWLNVMAPGKQRDTAAKEYTAMLAAAPSPDQFRGAAKMVPAPAEVPMPEPDTHCYDDDEQRDVWSRTYQMLTYGDAREAAGYARGLREAGRNAERYSFLRGDGGPTSVRWPRWEVAHWNGNWNPVSGKELDAAIDADLRGGGEAVSMKCRLCGRGLNQIGGYLQRVNEKGVAGIWECRPTCEADLPEETAVLLAVEGEEVDELRRLGVKVPGQTS